MTFPFLTPKAKKRDQIVAIDLGSRVTKAVLLQRVDEKYKLVRYVILDAPISEKAITPSLLGDHLRQVVQGLETKTRQITLSIGSQETILRTVELPLLPVEEMRQMLKYNSKTYLQQDLPDYVFDCYFVPPQNLVAPVEGVKAPPPAKYKVWVGGVKRKVLTDLEAAIKNAGLIPDQITLGLLGPANAFELLPPTKEAVALVDLGFKSSSISVIAGGDLCLSRVVETGGNDITASLAETMGISYAEAEGIKIGMPAEVEAHLLPVLGPLGRDLRASIDYFEHHQDLPVGQVLLSGGAARSEYFTQSLQTELMIPCKPWMAANALELGLSPQQTEDLANSASQLNIAIGAASSLF